MLKKFIIAIFLFSHAAFAINPASNILACHRPNESKQQTITEIFSRIPGSQRFSEYALQNLSVQNCSESTASFMIHYDDGMRDPVEMLIHDGEKKIVGPLGLSVTRNEFFSCLSADSMYGKYEITCKLLTIPEQTKPSCFTNAKHSRNNVFSVSSSAIECVTQALDEVFNGTTSDAYGRIGNHSTKLFQNFKSMMQGIVFTALMIYVTIFGYKVLLGQEAAIKKGEIMMLIFKVIFVLYFSIGLKQPDGSLRNGIEDIAYPTLTAASNSLSSYILKAAGTEGLCNNFNAMQYDKGFEHLSLWDTLDCKVVYYLTLMSPKNLLTSASNANSTDLQYIGSMFAMAAASEWILLVFLLLFIFIFVISTAIYFVHHFILCLISLTFTLFLAPLFVPMILFQQTRSFFDAWLKLAISYALQPVIVTAFLALMLTIYDQALFGTCVFSSDPSSPFAYNVVNGSDEKCYNTVGYLLAVFKNNAGEEFFTAHGPALLSAAKTTFLFSFLFYYFAGMVSNFAADVTGGVSVTALGGNPHMVTGAAARGIRRGTDALIGLARKRNAAAQQGPQAPDAPIAPGGGNGDGDGINMAQRDQGRGGNG